RGERAGPRPSRRPCGDGLGDGFDPVHPARGAAKTGQGAAGSGRGDIRTPSGLTSMSRQKHIMQPVEARPAARGATSPAESEGLCEMNGASARKRTVGWRLAAGAIALALGVGAAAAGPALPNGAIAIARQGAFEAGGKVLGDPAKASLSCDHGHVEYEIPVGAKKTALFLWHSS